MDKGFERDQVLRALLRVEWKLLEATNLLVSEEPEDEPTTIAVEEAPTAPTTTGTVCCRVLDNGYMVLCTPKFLAHLRGHHQCDQDELRKRFQADSWGVDRAGFCIRMYKIQEDAEKMLAKKRLQLPFPIDPTPSGSE